MRSTPLRFDPRRPVRAANGGIFVSRGEGAHPDRVIDSYELILGRRGTLAIAEEGRAFAVAPGDALLLWPNRRHVGAAPYGRDLSFYWLHFSLPPSRGGRRIEAPQFVRLPKPERLASLFHRFLDDQESPERDPHAADLLVTLMLVELHRASRRPAPAHGAAAALAARALAFITAHAAEPISTVDVAARLGVSDDYLGRVFRRTYGRTLVETIHRLRLKNAKGLLIETNLSLDRVAAEVGIADAAYLRRLFRRYEGMTPGQFRRMHARRHINTR